MKLGLFLYRFATLLLSPFFGIILRRRVASGKEFSGRLNERFAKNLQERPASKLIWLHAASVGESKVLMALANRIAPSQTSFLFTCQTKTAAILIQDAIDAGDLPRTAIQQMAPLDSASISKRFLSHWAPDLAIFAEGEVWPNLLTNLHKREIPTAMINARMTQKSIQGWAQWPRTACEVFGTFDLILSSDKGTQKGLTALTGKDIALSGNLKSALPPPVIDEASVAFWRTRIGERPSLLAASTHAPEEAELIKAWMQISNRPFLILAPRHPERGDDIAALIETAGIQYARRHATETISSETEILLADTMGEMGLWYRLADAVYLGGGHAPGIGGHNPIEALQLGKPVITGPELFNFADIAADLRDKTGFTMISSLDDLAANFPSEAPSQSLIDHLKSNADAPMDATLNALKPLLHQAEIAHA